MKQTGIIDLRHLVSLDGSYHRLAKDLLKGNIDKKQAKDKGLLLANGILKGRKASQYKQYKMYAPIVKAVNVVLKDIKRAYGVEDPNFTVGALNGAADTIYKIRKKINLNNNALRRQGYKSMNNAQKEAHVLKSAKRYRVKGGSARQLVGEIRKDANRVGRLFDKVHARQGRGRDINSAMAIIKKYQTHPLYRALGIERDVSTFVKRAIEDTRDIYKAWINGKDSKMDMIRAHQNLLSIATEVQRAYDKKHGQARYS